MKADRPDFSEIYDRYGHIGDDRIIEASELSEVLDKATFKITFTRSADVGAIFEVRYFEEVVRAFRLSESEQTYPVLYRQRAIEELDPNEIFFERGWTAKKLPIVFYTAYAYVPSQPVLVQVGSAYFLILACSLTP